MTIFINETKIFEDNINNIKKLMKCKCNKTKDENIIFLIEKKLSLIAAFELYLKSCISLPDLKEVSNKKNIQFHKNVTYLSLLKNLLIEIDQNSKFSWSTNLPNQSGKRNLNIHWTSFYPNYIIKPRNEGIHDFALSSNFNTYDKLLWFTNQLFDFATKILVFIKPYII